MTREDQSIHHELQTSKLWNTQHHPNDVERSLDECLAELELTYLDLYLVHWPVAFKSGPELFPLANDTDVAIDNTISIVDTWKAMTKLPKSKARSIGVSNHAIDHVRLTNKEDRGIRLIITARGHHPSHRRRSRCQPDRTSPSPAVQRPDRLLPAEGYPHHRLLGLW